MQCADEAGTGAEAAAGEAPAQGADQGAAHNDESSPAQAAQAPSPGEGAEDGAGTTEAGGGGGGKRTTGRAAGVKGAGAKREGEEQASESEGVILQPRKKPRNLKSVLDESSSGGPALRHRSRADSDHLVGLPDGMRVPGRPFRNRLRGAHVFCIILSGSCHTSADASVP